MTNPIELQMLQSLLEKYPPNHHHEARMATPNQYFWSEAQVLAAMQAAYRAGQSADLLAITQEAEEVQRQLDEDAKMDEAWERAAFEAEETMGVDDEDVENA